MAKFKVLVTDYQYQTLLIAGLCPEEHSVEQ